MTIRRLLPLAMAALMGVGIAACSDDEPTASDLVGDYRCNAVAYTTYTASNGTTRDTAYHGSTCTVSITRVDDQTVAITAPVNQWSWTTFAASGITLRDAGTGDLVNLTGDGTIHRAGVSTGYPASVSGTFSTDSKDLALSLRVGNYSQRLTLSLTTR